MCCSNIFYRFKIISDNVLNWQASGRAVYINDIAGQPGECYAEFVLSTEANAKIQSIDPSEALVNLDLFLLNVFWYITCSSIKFYCLKISQFNSRVPVYFSLILNPFFNASSFFCRNNTVYIMSVRCSIGSKLVTTNHYVTDYKMKLSTRKRLTELIRKMFFMTYFTFQAILPLIINVAFTCLQYL